MYANIDWYQGKPIIYSLGNCVFNYFPHDLRVYYGWSVQLTFGKPTGIELKTTVLTSIRPDYRTSLPVTIHIQ